MHRAHSLGVLRVDYQNVKPLSIRAGWEDAEARVIREVLRPDGGLEWDLQ
jgi:hypothetical protein